MVSSGTTLHFHNIFFLCVCQGQDDELELWWIRMPDRNLVCLPASILEIPKPVLSDVPEEVAQKYLRKCEKAFTTVNSFLAPVMLYYAFYALYTLITFDIEAMQKSRRGIPITSKFNKKLEIVFF